jgi:two-component system, NtrC family, sensor kinase
MDTPEDQKPDIEGATSSQTTTHQIQSEEKDFYSRIIQNAAAPMLVIDAQHTILFWNNALAKLTGKSSFQMRGTKQQWTPFYAEKRPLLADLLIDQKLKAIENSYSGVEASHFVDGAYRAEGWYENVGGKRRYLLFEAAPITNRQNEIVAAIETIEDITERKLAQDILDNQHRFLQEILEAIPNPVFYKDTNNAFIGCNKAFSAFFGKTVSEVIGKTLAHIAPPEQALVSFARDRQVLETLTAMTYETPMLRCDGQERAVLVTKAPFLNADGTLGGIVGTFVDVTEQRKLDEQIMKMSRAVEQSPTTIVITDLEGRIEYVNPKFSKTTGYSREEAIGNNPRVLKSGEMPVEGYSDLWATISSGKEWHGEFHNKRKDGELYWEYASISPLTDKDGQITGFLAVKEDITSRKETEAALASSQNELLLKHKELGNVFDQVKAAKREWEDTLDSLQDFVILTDAEHRIRRCNRLLCDITGMAYNDVIARDWRELLKAAGFNFVKFDNSRGELRHNTTERYYDLTVYDMKDQASEKITGFVVSLNDTTEIRSVTEELKRTSQELNEAHRAVYQQEKMASIGQLAAGVAHEINNPMGFISSNLNTLGKYLEKINTFESTLMDKVTAGSNPELSTELKGLRKSMKIDFIMDDIRNLIDESRDGAERVRRIVQDLKSFSHVDEAEYKLFSINECLDSTINMARNEIKYVADVELDYTPDLPQLNCYPQQLNQVFMNLLVNAAHAIEGHGTITVSTRLEADDIIVKISDTGKGIAPENLTRIFEPFYTTKEVGKGTGLGLSISYDIVKKHGGAMSVESEIGIGTTFTIRLPLDHQFDVK